MTRTVPGTVFPRLTRREFARALRLGLGRARLDVRRHGLAGREDLLIAACLRNATRDPQMEGSLAGWLFAIAREGGVSAQVRDALLTGSRRKLHPHDARQIADMLARLAEDGDRVARAALFRMIDRNPLDDRCGAQDAVYRLELAGLRHVVRSWGRRWHGGDKPDLGWIAFAAREEIGMGRARAALERIAAAEPALRPFVRDLANRIAPDRARVPHLWAGTLEEHERFVEGTDELRVWVWGWHRAASLDVRREAWRRLLAERRPRVLRRRLFAWRHAALSLPQRLLALTAHPDPRVRTSVAHLLRESRSSRLRSLALRRLRTDPRRAVQDGMLELLELNARVRDADAVLAAFPGRRSRELLHDWVGSAYEIARDRLGARGMRILELVVEESPCRWCREFAIDALVDRRRAPRVLLREALWDADDDIRKTARKAPRR